MKTIITFLKLYTKFKISLLKFLLKKNKNNIGENVFIKEGISIGSHSIIGANSVVTKDVFENTIEAVSPAHLIKLIKKP